MNDRDHIRSQIRPYPADDNLWMVEALAKLASYHRPKKRPVSDPIVTADPIEPKPKKHLKRWRTGERVK